MISPILLDLFFPFEFKDAIDIFLVSVLLYQLYRLLRGTVAVNIFIGVIVIYFIGLMVNAMEMKLLGTIIKQFIGVGGIALIILFQQEIRKFLIFMGMKSWNNPQVRMFQKWFPLTKNSSKATLNINALVQAIFSMAKTKTGALIILSNNTDLSFHVATGDKLDANLSARMLESIFFKNSPLHDGAVIIAKNKIIAARCVLPVTEKEDFPGHLGMRHRAATGITEVADCIALVVSEETGTVSYVKNGVIKANLDQAELIKLIHRDYQA
ncbi:MAG: diadenylate cyclase [Saprospiraceae bacterium]|jgi:diadenylate cyclase